MPDLFGILQPTHSDHPETKPHAPISLWSATTCLLADFDVAADGTSGILLRFNDRSRGFEGDGVGAGHGLFSNVREDMQAVKKEEKKGGGVEFLECY